MPSDSTEGEEEMPATPKPEPPSSNAFVLTSSEKIEEIEEANTLPCEKKIKKPRIKKQLRIVRNHDDEEEDDEDSVPRRRSSRLEQASMSRLVRQRRQTRSQKNKKREEKDDGQASKL